MWEINEINFFVYLCLVEWYLYCKCIFICLFLYRYMYVFFFFWDSLCLSKDPVKSCLDIVQSEITKASLKLPKDCPIKQRSTTYLHNWYQNFRMLILLEWCISVIKAKNIWALTLNQSMNYASTVRLHLTGSHLTLDERLSTYCVGRGFCKEEG